MLWPHASPDMMSGDLDRSGHSHHGCGRPLRPSRCGYKNYADMALTVPTSPITNGVSVVKADGMTLENDVTTTNAPNNVAYVAVRRISGLSDPHRTKDVAMKAYVDSYVDSYVNSLLMMVFSVPARMSAVGVIPIDVLQAQLPASWIGRYVVILASIHGSPNNAPPADVVTVTQPVVASTDGVRCG